MRLDEVMAALRAAANPGSVSIYRRHGVKEEVLGVSYAELGRLAKRVAGQHELAQQLWETGVHDARVLALMVAAPDRVARAELEAWLRVASNYVIVDAIAALAAKSPMGLELALEWIGSPQEWISAAGWSAIGALALQHALDERTGRKLLKRIRSHIHGAPNRTRHCMNGALIAMGGAVDELTDEALEAARAIGPVVVDHGETGCKTPDAVPYIEKMLARRSAKAERARGSKPTRAPRDAAAPTTKAPGRSRSARRA